MTAHKETGGPAFPMTHVTVLAEDGTPNESCEVGHAGMTLRDYFAAKAMQGFAATLTGTARVFFDTLAFDAYAMADAMLKARNK